MPVSYGFSRNGLLIVTASLLGCLTTVLSAVAEDFRSENSLPRQTIFLNGECLSVDPQRKWGSVEVGTMDEIVRQSLMIAARDELGCVTRDFWLGETASHGDSIFCFRLLRSNDIHGLSLTLQRHGPAGTSLVSHNLNVSQRLQYSSPYDMQDFCGRLKRMELASRRELVALLQQFGIKGHPNAWHVSAPVPKQITDWLNEPTFTSQYAAVRALHRLMHEDGESPERLAALVEGYLHLSYLTECYFHPMHEVFKIRAVLYAHRLTKKKDPKNRYARGIRFATLALAGFHQDAVKTWRSRLNRNPSRPAWMDLAEPCLEYDMKTLAGFRDDKRFGPWAKLYEYRTAKYAADADKTKSLCSQLLSECPHCHALYGVPLLCERAQYLDPQQQATQHLGHCLYDQMATIPDLPEPITRLIARGRQFKGAGEHPEEYALRKQLAANLVSSDGCGSPRNDPNELSWQVLGSMIRELSFCQVHWRAFFLRYAGPSQPITVASQWIDETDELTRDHRFRPFLDSYGDAAQRRNAVKQIPTQQEKLEKWLYRVQGRDFPLWLFTLEYPQGDNIWYIVRTRSVDANTDGANINAAFDDAIFACSTKIPNLNKSHGATHVACSPYNPWALYYQTKAGDWRARALVESRWHAYDDHPEIKAALGLALCHYGEYAEAVRRLESVRSEYPKFELYNALARAYLKLDNEEAFFRTLDAFCALPGARDVEKAVFQLLAARTLLAGHDRTSAMKRLARAAKYNTSEGRLARSLILELDGQFEEAFRVLTPFRHQPEGPFLDWYWASLRAKGGSQKQGQEELLSNCQQYWKLSLRTIRYSDLAAHYAIALTTIDLPERRILTERRMRFRFVEPGVSLYRIHRFLQTPIAEDKTNGYPCLERDVKTSKYNNHFPISNATATLAACFIRDLEDGVGGEPNTTQIDDLLAEARLADRAQLLYFVGAYYARYGHEGQAVDYWKRAVPLPVIRNSGRNLAVYELRKRGMTDAEYKRLIDSWFSNSN